MNKQLIAERFSKAIHTYSQEACVQRQIADKMTRLLTEHLTAPCPKVIEFGCGTGVYSRLLLKALQPDELLLNDLCPEMEQCCSDLLKEKQISFLPGDAETVSFPGQRSLITSCSALQWFESPRRFFERCHSLLQQQGYFAFSTFGEENMKDRQRALLSLPRGTVVRLVCPFPGALFGRRTHSAFVRHPPAGALSPQADRSNRCDIIGLPAPAHPKRPAVLLRALCP